MNKFLTILALAASVTACNNEASTDTKAADTPAAKTEVTQTPETTTPAVKDSVMQFKDGKVMIMAGGSWAALSATVTTTNGRKVSPNGEVSKGKVTRKMEEGMMIDKDGQMMDKDGKMMDNTGWE
jgi:uncharacterized cupredoxin-like copper-binding protein